MNTLRLACHHLRFHKAKTVILVVCIGLTIYLPLTSHWLVSEFDPPTLKSNESGNDWNLAASLTVIVLFS